MTFEEHDRLKRDKYAIFIKSILENHQRYRRNQENKSFVLAIDSPWGTGKTTFIHMLRSLLDEENTTDSDIIISTAYYNAWENDFWKNPFESLVQTFLDDDLIDQNADGAIEIIKNIGKLSGKIATGFLLRRTLGEDAVSSLFGSHADATQMILDEAKSLGDIKLLKKAVSPEYITFKENIEGLKNVLKEFIDKPHPKFPTQKRMLVVFVDELDRCRPDFAIETLEIVKHFFDVERLAFVFSLDVEQLSSTASTIYGSTMDTTGYLMRFFDYVCRIPEFDKSLYIKAVMEPEYKHLLLKDTDLEEFKNAFSYVAHTLSLSLRDIETIYSSFLILENHELYPCINVKYYCTFLGLLCLKYKQPQTYHNFINYLPQLVSINDVSAKIWPHFKMSNRTYNVNPSPHEQLINVPMWNDLESNKGYLFDSFDGDQLIFRDRNGNRYPDSQHHSNHTAFTYMFSKKDLQLWDNYRHLTVGQYLSRKLEAFNFSPSITDTGSLSVQEHSEELSMS